MKSKNLILYFILFAFYSNAQTNVLPNKKQIADLKINQIIIKSCPDLTCLSSTNTRLCNFYSSGNIKNTYVNKVAKSNSPYFTTTTEKAEYREFIYNSIDSLIQIKSRIGRICQTATVDDTLFTKYEYLKNGKIKSITKTQSCCNEVTKFQYINSDHVLTSGKNINCTNKIETLLTDIYYKNNVLIKEEVKGNYYSIYEYNKSNTLIKIYTENSNGVIKIKAFEYNLDGSLFQETIYSYAKNKPERIYENTKYIYKYKDGLLSNIARYFGDHLDGYEIYQYKFNK